MIQPANITSTSKFLSFDVESNGLHGDAFAVAGLVIQADGQILDQFSARCPIVGEVDPWVKKNVLKSLQSMEEDTKDASELRTKFWSWFTKAKEDSDFVLVNNGYPVEYRFLIDCQEDDIDSRYWEHPYPVLEVASIYLAAGIKPLTPASELVADQIRDIKGDRHHPMWDAHVSALAAIEVLKRCGQIK